MAVQEYTVESSTITYSVGGFVFEELSWAQRYLQSQIKYGKLDSNTRITKIRSEAVTLTKEFRTKVKE